MRCLGPSGIHLEGQLAVGRRYRSLVVDGGYDVQEIGDVLFHGPVAGLQLWFSFYG